MSILIDIKYANQLATRLPKYKLKKTSPFLAECRCIVCGDSQTDLKKRRFYVFEKKGRIKVHCHNCGYDSRIGFFLKDHQPDLYKEYIFDLFAERRIEREADPILTPRKPVAEKKGGALAGLKRISQLPVGHPAKLYIEGRKIPPEAHSRLYFTSNFQKWINELIPGKFEKLPKYDPRIVIPFLDKKGNVFAVQGRGISDKQMRYITIKIDEEHPKVFGLDRIDTNFRIWVFEGPLDSLFIDNSLAMAGADISNSELCNLLSCDKDRIVKVYDNEPRAVEIINRMNRDIADGYKVVIWPRNIHSKDVNKMILDEGLTPANILMLMRANTFSGLDAKLKLATWGKVVSSRF